MVRRATGGPSDVSLSHTWQTLAEHLDEVRPRHLRDLFQLDPERGQRFSEEAAGWYLDYSKNRITRRTLELLLRLACTSRLPAKIDAMFNGDPVNSSEGRAALHVALRMPADASVRVDGRDVVPDVQRVLRRMENFAGKVRSGTWFGGTGKKIRNIVNLGIGGSAIGVGMACAALQHYGRRDMQFRFVSNMDGADFFLATRDLDPRETLFIVCSKTFHTPETLRNAAAARAWCLEDIQDEGALRAHFVAVTGNRDAAIEAGFAPEHVFDVWEWVNGRYSLCSAMGLALLTAIGPAAFREMLAGFHDMDTHFLSAPMKQNLPVLLGLMGVWNNNFLGARSVAILPYAHDLRRFPSYVQQLMMESNGKSVTQDGAPVGSITSPVYWGACGTNGQHSSISCCIRAPRSCPATSSDSFRRCRHRRAAMKNCWRTCTPRPRPWPSDALWTRGAALATRRLEGSTGRCRGTAPAIRSWPRSSRPGHWARLSRSMSTARSLRA